MYSLTYSQSSSICVVPLTSKVEISTKQCITETKRVLLGLATLMSVASDIKSNNSKDEWTWAFWYISDLNSLEHELYEKAR